MFTASDAACSHLSDMLQKADTAEGAILRIVVTEGDCSMTVGRADDGDLTFEHERQTLLAIEPTVAELINDPTLDVESTPDGPMLGFVSNVDPHSE